MKAVEDGNTVQKLVWLVRIVHSCVRAGSARSLWQALQTSQQRYARVVAGPLKEASRPFETAAGSLAWV